MTKKKATGGTKAKAKASATSIPPIQKSSHAHVPKPNSKTQVVISSPTSTSNPNHAGLDDDDETVNGSGMTEDSNHDHSDSEKEPTPPPVFPVYLCEWSVFWEKKPQLGYGSRQCSLGRPREDFDWTTSESQWTKKASVHATTQGLSCFMLKAEAILSYGQYTKAQRAQVNLMEQG